MYGSHSAAEFESVAATIKKRLRSLHPQLVKEAEAVRAASQSIGHEGRVRSIGMAARVSYCLVCRDRRDEWKEAGLARGRVFDAIKHSWQYRELVKDRKLFTEDQRQDVIAWLSHYNLIWDIHHLQVSQPSRLLRDPD